MRLFLPAGLALALLAGAASAQTSPAPAATGEAHKNAAVDTTPADKAGPVAPGANSFTQGQAQEHIAKAGYAKVSGLMKDDKGVWRGTAMKKGKPVKVALDFKGNVTSN